MKPICSRRYRASTAIATGAFKQTPAICWSDNAVGKDIRVFHRRFPKSTI